jgi:hypothetical protein
MRRLVLSALIAGMALAGFGLVAAPAQADAKVYLKVWPAQGTLNDTINLYLPTGAFCPAEANRVIVRMTGPLIDQAPGTETEWGFNLTGNTDITALDPLSIPGTSIFPLLWTWRDAGGNMTPNPVDFDGKYRITLWCLKGLDFRNSLGDTIADVVINHDENSFEVTTPQPKGPEDAVLGVDPSDTTDPSTAPPTGSNSAEPTDPSTTDSAANSSTGPGPSAGPNSSAGPEPTDGGQSAGVDSGSSSGTTGAGQSGDANAGVGGSTGAQQPVSAATPEQGSSGRNWILIAGAVLIAAGVAYGFWGRKKSPAA